MHDFDDIRPYRDDEARAVVDSLLAAPELSAALGRFLHPMLFRLLPGVVGTQVRRRLRQELRHIRTIHDVQIVIEKYLDRLIEDTTTSLTHTGLDQLNHGRPYLFISNHRDIAMDPALVNYMLYHQGFDTLQIAIGDNLLKRPFLSDLMRLNKSFIVKRSLAGREKLKASKQLSAYIHHCIEQGENVWIAQREGRAKDGMDRTESAIIKMLHMAGRERGLSLHESINALNIVPVAISYEFDPCDESKARELHAIDTTGRFEKDENSDVRSILDGMVGNKGDVHVAYGQPLVLAKEASAEDIARMIDQQVVASYRLHLSNYLALEQLKPDYMDFSSLAATFRVGAREVARKRERLRERLARIAPELRPYVLRMYANPALRQLEYLAGHGAEACVSPAGASAA